MNDTLKWFAWAALVFILGLVGAIASPSVAIAAGIGAISGLLIVGPMFYFLYR